MAACLKGISNQELISRLKGMVKKERELTHRIVLHLAEVSRRRLYAEAGYPSMFEYACKVLGYSRSSAQRRIVAARIVAKFPEVYDCLEDGRLSLRVLEVAADAMDRPNARELLGDLCGKSREEALKIVAYHLPIEPKKLADKIEPVVSAAKRVSAATGQLALLTEENSNYSRAGVITNSIGNVEPEEEEPQVDYRFSFTADAALKAKVERAWELLECYDLETVMHKAFDEYLAKHCPIERNKRRKEKVERRLAKQGERILESWDTVQSVADNISREDLSSKSRFPSLKLRDEILERDGYQCTYVAPDGTRCSARDHLQIDHIIPHAHCGETVASNLRTTCRTHNHQLAREWYGDAYIDQVIRERKPDNCGRPTVPPPQGSFDTQVNELLFGERFKMFGYGALASD